MHNSAHQFIKVVTGLTAGTFTGTHSGPAIDCRGFREALVHFNVGTPGATTDNAVVLTMQESPSTTAGSFAAITGASIAIASANDETVHVIAIDLEPRKRYIRAQIVAAAGTDYDCGVSVDLLNADVIPVTQVNTATRV